MKQNSKSVFVSALLVFLVGILIFGCAVSPVSAGMYPYPQTQPPQLLSGYENYGHWDWDDDVGMWEWDVDDFKFEYNWRDPNTKPNFNPGPLGFWEWDYEDGHWEWENGDYYVDINGNPMTQGGSPNYPTAGQQQSQQPQVTYPSAGQQQSQQQSQVTYPSAGQQSVAYPTQPSPLPVAGILVGFAAAGLLLGRKF